ncbi:hypothetical protein T484DRAFT_1934596 [Baffinella frigidus]|nr:hypothetical protein T484DRAFT_1934596 [Cryptophyta sp. CCMP2293]
MLLGRRAALAWLLGLIAAGLLPTPIQTLECLRGTATLADGECGGTGITAEACFDSADHATDCMAAVSNKLREKVAACKDAFQPECAALSGQALPGWNASLPRSQAIASCSHQCKIFAQPTQSQCTMGGCTGTPTQYDLTTTTSQQPLMCPIDTSLFTADVPKICCSVYQNAVGANCGGEECSLMAKHISDVAGVKCSTARDCIRPEANLAASGLGLLQAHYRQVRDAFTACTLHLKEDQVGCYQGEEVLLGLCAGRRLKWKACTTQAKATLCVKEAAKMITSLVTQDNCETALSQLCNAVGATTRYLPWTRMANNYCDSANATMLKALPGVMAAAPTSCKPEGGGECVDVKLCSGVRRSMPFCEHLAGNSFYSRSLMDDPLAWDKTIADGWESAPSQVLVKSDSCRTAYRDWVCTYNALPCDPETNFKRELCITACERFYKCNVTDPAEFNTTAASQVPNLVVKDGESEALREVRRIERCVALGLNINYDVGEVDGAKAKCFYYPEGDGEPLSSGVARRGYARQRSLLLPGAMLLLAYRRYS